MAWRFLLVVIEIALITFWNYKMAGSHYSLDVLYSLPIIHAARIGAIRSQRHSDGHMPALVGVITAVVWSLAEAAVVWPSYPLDAFVLNIFTRSVAFTVLGRVLAKLWKERDFFRKDALTGLANRFAFTERFSAEQLRSEWSSRPCSLLVVKINKLEILHDSHNKRAEETALKDVSGILMANSRVVDTVARVGGNEFVMLFPETDDYICSVLGMRIKSASEKIFQAKQWPLSLSVGHVTMTSSVGSFDEMLQRAHQKIG